MTRIRQWILVAALAGAVLVMMPLTVFFMIRAERAASQVELAEFSVCEGSSCVFGLPQVPIDTVSTNAEALFACGYLRTTRPASLRFLLYRNEKPLGWFVLSTRYEPGYLCEELPPDWRAPGSYRVAAWHTKYEIASTQFVVVEP